MRNLKRQHGGTITGVIIGLVVGLAIALTVAVVITKIPMPFTDKAGQLKWDELTDKQSTDPNRPLYDKRTPVRSEVATSTPPNTTLPEPGNRPQEVTLGSARDGGGAPVVELSAPASYTPPPVKSSSDDPWRYFLQAGAFRGRPDAESMRGRLALEGVDAAISEYHSDNGLLYRVRIGPFNQLEAMNRVRGTLSDSGIDAAVVRVAR